MIEQEKGLRAKGGREKHQTTPEYNHDLYRPDGGVQEAEEESGALTYRTLGGELSKKKGERNGGKLKSHL